MGEPGANTKLSDSFTAGANSWISDTNYSTSLQLVKGLVLETTLGSHARVMSWMVIFRGWALELRGAVGSIDGETGIFIRSNFMIQGWGAVCCAGDSRHL